MTLMMHQINFGNEATDEGFLPNGQFPSPNESIVTEAEAMISSPNDKSNLTYNIDVPNDNIDSLAEKVGIVIYENEATSGGKNITPDAKKVNEWIFIKSFTYILYDVWFLVHLSSIYKIICNETTRLDSFGNTTYKFQMNSIF